MRKIKGRVNWRYKCVVYIYYVITVIAKASRSLVGTVIRQPRENNEVLKFHGLKPILILLYFNKPMTR